MRIRRPHFIIGAFTLAFLVLGAGVASAISVRSGSNATLPTSETVDGTLYAAGSTVDIAGNVEGDVYCAGQNVRISGSVDGDVMCAGQNITIAGTINGDIRLAGQTVVISGEVAGSGTIGAQALTIDSSASIGRDLTTGAQNATLNGTVGRDLVYGGDTLVINGEIGRDITTGLESLQLQSSARVGGDIEYTSNNQIQIADGAVIGGETKRKIPPAKSGGPDWAFFSFPFGFAVYMVLSLLLINLALVLLFPAVFRSSANRALERPGRTALIGVVAVFLVPILLVALLITVIGIPLSLFLGLLWIVILLLSGPFFAYYLGRLLLPTQRNVLVTTLLGGLVVLIGFFVPILGALLALATIIMGTGMFLNETMARTPKPRYDIK